MKGESMEPIARSRSINATPRGDPQYSGRSAFRIKEKGVAIPRGRARNVSKYWFDSDGLLQDVSQRENPRSIIRAFLIFCALSSTDIRGMTSFNNIVGLVWSVIIEEKGEQVAMLY